MKILNLLLLVFVIVKCVSFTCYGIPSTQPNVCSGNGICIAQDTCQCNPNFNGTQCKFH